MFYNWVYHETAKINICIYMYINDVCIVFFPLLLFFKIKVINESDFVLFSIRKKTKGHFGTRPVTRLGIATHWTERSGSVVECLTRDRGAAGSSLIGVTALWVSLRCGP